MLAAVSIPKGQLTGSLSEHDHEAISLSGSARSHITAIGGWLGYFLGGLDGLMIALIVLMTLDYVSGVMCAIIDRKLSSAVGFKGVCKKVFILMLVGVAHIIDLHVVGTGSALRGAVICFYMSNEGLSLLENAAHIGLPIPDKLRDILAQLHDKERTTDQGDGE